MTACRKKYKDPSSLIEDPFQTRSEQDPTSLMIKKAAGSNKISQKKNYRRDDKKEHGWAK